MSSRWDSSIESRAFSILGRQWRPGNAERASYRKTDARAIQTSHRNVLLVYLSANEGREVCAIPQDRKRERGRERKEEREKEK